MIITLNITEDSKVELIKDDCKAVQGEHNATTLKLNLPSTIKGYSINNYQKNIEFKECKDFGECAKFYDVVQGDTYNLCNTCTKYKKIMIQFTLTNRVDEAEPIIWKTIPFALEFTESINAENEKEVQVALLSLAEILDEWENYIKANTLRMVYKAGEVPTADAKSLGDTIFYLGANTTEPYALEYGYYYRCELVDGEYTWVNIVKDPSIGDVSNGIKEINKNAIIQFWQGTQEELDNEVKQPNVFYIPTDQDTKAEIDEILREMVDDKNYNLAYPFKHEEAKQRLKFGDNYLLQKQAVAVSPYVNDAGFYVFDTLNTSLFQEGSAVKVKLTYTDGSKTKTCVFNGYYNVVISTDDAEAQIKFYPIQNGRNIETLFISRGLSDEYWTVEFKTGTVDYVSEKGREITAFELYKIVE